ncbi:MAG TPA: MBL fold metallo-hydrolase [Candidatus Limnocylindrales bacterium]
MEIQFLGAATTVTGSQFLLTTDRARILIDCGMFQGSPNEAIRNRIPLAYDPAEIDAILLTHAHLDHCGLIPHVVKEGFKGPIWATKGTVELATLVLLDSGKLQREFAKRAARLERRHPERAAEEAHREQLALEAAMELAGSGDVADDSGHGGSQATSAIEPYLAVPQGNGGLGNHDNVIGLPDPEAALNAQPPHLDVELDEPLYDAHDAEAALAQFRGIDYGQELEIAPGIHATFMDAGHILGSAIIRVRAADAEAGPERVIVFSGDVGRCDTPIIRDPTYLTDADYVLVESTYGGREHEPQDEAVRLLAETVKFVGDGNGVLLVPSFAIGRTQEVVWQLDRLLDQGAIPELPLYLDSPMASKATDVYRHHAEYFDPETRALLQQGETPLDYPRQVITRDVKESEAIAQAPRPYMIVASNGMLTGGRVVGHLRELIDDPDATLLFVGYQGEGTLGAHLQAGATQVKIDGQVRDVRCKIRSISGFSAHADESELLDWLRAFTNGKQRGDPGWPRTVFIVHGDPEAQSALEPKVRALGFDTVIPHWHQRVTLD